MTRLKLAASITMAMLCLAGKPAPALAGKTLDAVRQRGELVCGVSTGVGGFSRPRQQWRMDGPDHGFLPRHRRGGAR